MTYDTKLLQLGKTIIEEDPSDKRFEVRISLSYNNEPLVTTFYSKQFQAEVGKFIRLKKILDFNADLRELAMRLYLLYEGRNKVLADTELARTINGYALRAAHTDLLVADYIESVSVTLAADNFEFNRINGSLWGPVVEGGHVKEKDKVNHANAPEYRVAKVKGDLVLCEELESGVEAPLRGFHQESLCKIKPEREILRYALDLLQYRILARPHQEEYRIAVPNGEAYYNVTINKASGSWKLVKVKYKTRKFYGKI